MDQLGQDLLRSVIPALVIAPITAFLTVRFSIREFRSRWWWERKAEAYSNIIEQLGYLEVYLRVQWDKEIGARVPNDEYMKEVYEKYHTLESDLLQVAAKGEYIVSDEVAAELRNLMSELNKWDPRGNLAFDIDRWAVAQKQAIKNIRSLAKRDLGVN